MSHYRKGAKAERRAKRELEAKGYVVTRAAGSKGGADLIAVLVRQIQVKAGPPKAWTAELDDMEAGLPSAPGMTRELWHWVDGCGWEKHEIDRDNPGFTITVSDA